MWELFVRMWCYGKLVSLRDIRFLNFLSVLMQYFVVFILLVVGIVFLSSLLSPNSDQQQFSPNNVHTLSRDEVVRI